MFPTTRGVTLLIPVKPPSGAKTRLRGAVDRHRHAGLVLAMLCDTVEAARRARLVGLVVVISPDPMVRVAVGVPVVADEPGSGLNSALRHGASTVRGPVGALQADLPALRPADLDAAIEEAAGRRAFCADRQKMGTTLLLAGAAGLRPLFGPGSALGHARSGAAVLVGALRTLRCDVDTPDDLAVAEALGVGEKTRSVLADRQISR